MKDKIELLPCPFCGSPGVINQVGLDGWRCRCSKGCCTTGNSLMDEKDNIKAWNRRTPSPTKAECEGCNGTGKIVVKIGLIPSEETDCPICTKPSPSGTWPERSIEPPSGFEDNYARGLHHGANKMYDAFMTEIKRRGLV